MSDLSLLSRVKTLESKVSELESNKNKLLGKLYSGIGNTSSDLLLKTRAGVKVQCGRKFIDLIKDGKVAVDASCVYEADSVGSKDGIYVIGEGDDVSVILKVGDQTIILIGEIGTTYVSFMGEQETTADMKYTALTNIGFLYPSLSDFDSSSLQNGIIYVESTLKLYIVVNGKVSEYTIEFPNPFTEQFVVAKTTSGDGAIVIQGEGTENSLMFDSLLIYVEDDNTYIDAEGNIFIYLNGTKRLTISSSSAIFTTPVVSSMFKSSGATSTSGFRLYVSNGESTLEVDNLIVRNGIDGIDLDLIPYPILWFFSNNVISSAFAYGTSLEEEDEDEDEEEEEDEDEDEEEEEDEDEEDDYNASDYYYKLTLKYTNQYSVGDILYVYTTVNDQLIVIPLKVEKIGMSYDYSIDFDIAVSDDGDIVLIDNNDTLYEVNGTNFVLVENAEYTWSYGEDDDTPEYYVYNDTNYYVTSDYEIDEYTDYIVITIDSTDYTYSPTLEVEGTDLFVSLQTTDFDEDYDSSGIVDELESKLVFKVASENASPIVSVGETIDVITPTSYDDLQNITSVTNVRVGSLDNLEKNIIFDNTEEIIEGIGIYTDILLAKEAAYTSDYTLEEDDNSSRFASTEWVNNKVGSLVIAGYYWSSDISDNEPVSYTYIGTTYEGFEVSESLPYLWYTNDGETWSLIDLYIDEESLDSSTIYFRSTHYHTLSITDDDGNIVSYSTFPAGYIEISIDGSNYVYDTFISTDSITDSNKTSFVTQMELFNTIMSLSGIDYAIIPSTGSATIYGDDTTLTCSDFLYIWKLDTTQDTVTIESIVMLFPELTISLSNVHNLTTNYNYSISGNIAGVNAGSHFCYLDKDGSTIAAVINFYNNKDSTTDRWVTSIDTSLDLTNSGYIYNWGDPYYMCAYILNVVGIFYSLNSDFYSANMNKFILNYDGSMLIQGAYGGIINLGLRGNSVTDNTFYPEFSIFAHVGIVPDSSYDVTFEAVFLVGSMDNYLKQGTVSAMSSDIYYTNYYFHKIYLIKTASVKIVNTDTGKIFTHYIENFYPYGEETDTQNVLGDFLADYNSDYRNFTEGETLEEPATVKKYIIEGTSVDDFDVTY